MSNHDEPTADHEELKDQLIGTMLVWVNFYDSFKRRVLFK